MLKDIRSRPSFLSAWGVSPEGLPLAREPLCPKCFGFSALSYCDPRRINAAVEWREATVGFAPVRLGSGYVGLVTLRCPACGELFAMGLTNLSFRAYIKDCWLWGQAKADLQE